MASSKRSTTPHAMELERERTRRYKAKHRERVLAAGREYAARNKEANHARIRAWRAANPDRQRAYNAAWDAAHREERAAKANAWRKANPEVAAMRREIGRRRIRNAPVVEKFTRAEIIARDKGVCHLCGKKVPKGQIHLDHLVPLSLGGEHSARNVAVAHAACNMRKRTKASNEQLRLVG